MFFLHTQTLMLFSDVFFYVDIAIRLLIKTLDGLWFLTLLIRQ